MAGGIGLYLMGTIWKAKQLSVEGSKTYRESNILSKVTTDYGHPNVPPPPSYVPSKDT